MTAITTRTPLQVVPNTNSGMSAPRRSARRSGARLAEKEEALKPATTFDESRTADARRADAGPTKNSKPGDKPASSDRRGKRKLDYDEEDDGFAFTRTKSKRTRASKGSSHEPAAEEHEAKQLDVRKIRKKPAERLDIDNERDAVTRRNGPLGSERDMAGKSEAQTLRGKGTTTTKSKGKHKSGADRQRTPSPKKGADVTKIALPFADTPVIRRNKEMRKGSGDGSRRSSLNMRGRRASSLIDSGTSNALPHAEVPTSEFYKHIESGLLEPRRMKQLLTWCATRALGTKPTDSGGDAPAQVAAHEIKEQLLNDFSTQSELSDWFGREDRAISKTALKPNPRNIANQEKIKQLEQRLARLRSERETWLKLLSPSGTSLVLPLPPTLLPISAIDASSLSTSDRSALSLLTPSSPASATIIPSSNTSPAALSTIPARVSTVAASAEFSIDRLADSAHVLAQHLKHAEDVGRQVLKGCAKRLEARERAAGLGLREGSRGQQELQDVEGEGDIGTRGVLRALSRVAER